MPFILPDFADDVALSTYNIQSIKNYRSHPEMVGDMSRVTLNYDLSKIPFVRF